MGDIITRHLTVEGMELLLAKRDILDPSFKQHLESLTSADAKAAEIEHAIRQEIHVHRDENPAAYASLWEQLERIVNKRREDRVAAASALEKLEELEALAAQVPNARAGKSESGSRLVGTAGRILPFVSEALPPDTRAEAASDIASALEGYASFVDWQHKEDVQRQMRRAIKERLRSAGIDPAAIEAATASMMDVARKSLAR